MTLPADFDRELWFDPLTFQGLIGSALAREGACYSSLFRADGFAKPKADLMQIPWVAKKIAAWERDAATFKACGNRNNARHCRPAKSSKHLHLARIPKIAAAAIEQFVDAIVMPHLAHGWLPCFEIVRMESRSSRHHRSVWHHVA